ncbi:type IV secretory system conjugative DNA transfer family protein [Croceitalea marina]|uniref:Type IV secretory system conjugative DNA transfer family protein n=2 Tax=Croceitalea TaxID=574891 RepID=A0ABW5MYP0_9FLAO
MIFKFLKYYFYAVLAIFPIGCFAMGIVSIFYSTDFGMNTKLDFETTLHTREFLMNSGLGIYFTINPILLYIVLYRFTKRWSKAFLFLSVGTFLQMTAVNLLFSLNIYELQYDIEQIYLIMDVLIACQIVMSILISRKSNKKLSAHKKIRLCKEGIVFDARPSKIYLNNPMRGIYIQGGAGSGKSESLFKPIIKNAVKKSITGILYDFKSTELTKYYYHHQQKGEQNLDVYFLDFLNPLKSHRLNPLAPEYLLKAPYAFEYSEVIINNLLPETIKERKYWDRDAQSILTGIIWFIKKHHPKQCSLPHIISLVLEADTQQLLDKVSSDPETAGMVVSLRQAMNRGAEKQVAGVISTLQTALSRLNNPEIFWLLSGNDLNLDLNNPESPKFLCIGNDSSLPQTYSPAISLIISVAAKLMNKPDKLPSTIILDEAPTLYIPNFEQLPATGRSNKISTVFGTQDYSQIVEKYGSDKAQVIIANLGNQFYGRTSNTKTAEIIQSVFSKEDKMYWLSNKSTGTSGQIVHLNSNDSRGKSQSIQERERLKVNQILKADTGQFYGIVAEGSPREFIGHRFKYDKSKIDIPENLRSMPEVNFDEIIKNYHKIIAEAQNIIKPKVVNTLLDI